jgi:gamma-glutamyltranspeptidase/glutathione hydrolase
MLDLGMGPQAALDAPRFCIDGLDSNAGPACLRSARVLLEEGLADEEAVAALRAMGHVVEGPVPGHARAVFGRGQVITRDKGSGVLCGGSDPRGDGLALGW